MAICKSLILQINHRQQSNFMPYLSVFIVLGTYVPCTSLILILIRNGHTMYIDFWLLYFLCAFQTVRLMTLVIYNLRRDIDLYRIWFAQLQYIGKKLYWKIYNNNNENEDQRVVRTRTHTEKMKQKCIILKNFVIEEGGLSQADAEIIHYNFLSSFPSFCRALLLWCVAKMRVSDFIIHKFIEIFTCRLMCISRIGRRALNTLSPVEKYRLTFCIGIQATIAFRDCFYRCLVVC